MYRIIQDKTCSCGQEHTGRTVEGKITEHGLWVDCHCKSTMLIPVGGFATVAEKSKRGRGKRTPKQVKPRAATMNKSIIDEYYSVLKGA
jgi:hypothetical protein